MANLEDSNTMPPSYYASNSSPGWPSNEAQSASAEDVLPPYPNPSTSSQRTLKEFSYKNSGSKDRPSVVLKIRADSRLSANIPTYMEGSSVTGTLELDLSSPDPIQAVTVSVRGIFNFTGKTGGSPDQELPFLDMCSQLWSQEQGDPKIPTPTNERKFTGNLNGKYSWPYHFKLPREVVLPVQGKDGETQSFRLPQTFLKRYTSCSIQYEVSARCFRGKMRTDHKIKAAIGYIPVIKPGPPSFLRQLAYQESNPIPGPEVDPEGWHTCGEVQVEGNLFNNRPIKMGCTLWLCKPLCYTRGSVIPMLMTLDAEDLQALDLLSSPKAIYVCLRRVVKYAVLPKKTTDAFRFKDTVDHSNPAVWWPTSERAENRDPRKRQIHGELHLESDMMPSSAIPQFRVEYYIALFPFESPAFKSPAGDSSEPLLLIPVEIASSFADGPRPRKYVPPGYEEAPQRRNLDQPITFSQADAF